MSIRGVINMVLKMADHELIYLTAGKKTLN